MDLILTNKNGFEISIPAYMKEKFIASGDFKESDFREIVETEAPTLVDMRATYKALYGKGVPPAKLKDNDWIQAKIAEFVPVDEVAPVPVVEVIETVDAPVEITE